MQSQLRYTKATALTVAAMAVLVALVVFEVIHGYVVSMSSPEAWANDTGQPVGILFGAVVAVFGMCSAAVGFPALAKYLVARGQYSAPRFTAFLLAGLAIPTLALGFLVALLLGSLMHLPIAAAIIYGLCSLFVVPFALLWCWLAR